MELRKGEADIEVQLMYGAIIIVGCALLSIVLFHIARKKLSQINV